MLELHAVPHSIGKLKHLRYLDLSENGNIEMLPNSITKLLNLQTLILKNCHSLRELLGINKLVNLRYLDITNCYKLADMTLEIRHLTSLEIVLPRVFVSKEDFKASCCGLYEKKMVESNGGPSQLKELSNLGGILEIGNLGHGKDDMLECDANLKEKEHLQLLELHWDATWVEDTECYDEMSLKRLEPHPNLKVLELHYYMGVRLPSWVSSHTNLVRLVLYYNCKLQHLSPLNQLPFLKSLTFYGIDALKYVSEDKVGNVFNSSSSKIPFFPSLSTLRIEQCPHLKGWWRNSNDDNEPNNLLLPSFPCLLRLEILKCPKLTCMPLFPYLKEELQLHVASWKVLQQTMEMGATTSTSSSSCCFPLSQLQSLKFVEVKDLESLPKRWLRNLISLRELSINWCRGLRSLPWIGNLTSLQRLQIGGCPDLTSLPQGIRHLTSLKRLQISGCPNLMSLPQGIRCLTSLKYLGISRCSLLRERCQSGTGADWSYIAHVPEVYVNGENQQKQTIS